MKYVVHRSIEDLVATISYQKSKKLKGRLIIASVISFLVGLLFFPTSSLSKFSVPLCIIVPFICLLSYREARRKVRDPRASSISEYEDLLHHFAGDLSIELKEGKIILSYEKCRDIDEIPKRSIKEIACKHGYMFIHYADNKICTIPEFDGLEQLKKEILYL